MRARLNRRELIGGAVAGLGLGGGAGADDALADAPPSDAELLSKTLEVERLMIFAYERVLASGALSSGVQRAIAPFLGHERAHASAVAATLTRLGSAATVRPMSLKEANDALSHHDVSDSLTGLHTEHQCLKLLIDLESVAEGASYTPIKDLRHPALVQMCAQILACEAQHWTVLSGLRNPGQYVKSIPWPYVFGSK